MYDTESFPEKILRQVTAFDLKAMDKLQSHADALFEEQKKADYVALKPQDPGVPNPLTMIRNFFACSFNTVVEHCREPYFIPVSTSSGCDLFGLPAPERLIYRLSPNLLTALVFYIERDRERVMNGARITPQDLRSLRDHAGWDRKETAPALEQHA